MSDPIDPIPSGYAGATPYLIVRDGGKAIDFYTQVFGAEEVLRLASPDDGSIGHAELRIAGGIIMLADEVPDMDIFAPPSVGGSSVGLMVYVEDPDAVFAAALGAGATQFKPVCDQFYGERSGTFDDPFGHRWTVSCRIEEMSHEEVRQKFEQLYDDGG